MNAGAPINTAPEAQRGEASMHEALYRFIHVHYIEILAAFPVIPLLIG